MVERKPQREPASRSSATVIGFALMLLSGVLFFVMLSVPWFPFSATVKGIIGVVLFVLVQSSWWIGVLMVGPAAIESVKRKYYGDSKSPENGEDSAE